MNLSQIINSTAARVSDYIFKVIAKFYQKLEISSLELYSPWEGNVLKQDNRVASTTARLCLVGIFPSLRQRVVGQTAEYATTEARVYLGEESNSTLGQRNLLSSNNASLFAMSQSQNHIVSSEEFIAHTPER